MWFYLTPIVYPLTLGPGGDGDPGVEVADRDDLLAEPDGRFTEVYRDLLYDLRLPDDRRHRVHRRSGRVVALAIGAGVVRRLEGRLAEEL